MKREREVDSYLATQCKKRRWYCVKQAPTLTGIPDRLIIAEHGLMAFAEVKDPQGKTSPAQDLLHQDFAERGVMVFTVYSKGDVDTLLEDLQRLQNIVYSSS